MQPVPRARASRPLWQHPWAYVAAWALCIAVCMGLTQLTHYQVHDPDSRLYAAMAQDMAAQPLGTWCAPQWMGHWQRTGLFYEHPPGLLWAGAALVRAGCAPEQALYVCNFLTLFGGLGLLWGIARRLARKTGDDMRVGLVAMAIWMGTPAFLQYLVRGNQEHPLCFCMLLGLYAVVSIDGTVGMACTWGLALALGLSIKGIAALALLPIAGLYWACYDRVPKRLVGLAVGSAMAAVAAVAFDMWAYKVTGASFWAQYFAGQVRHSVGMAQVGHKLANLAYYAARPLWFGLPAVALLATQAARKLRTQRPWQAPAPALVLGLWVTLVFVAGFSLANRKADRYIFPVYPALALAAAHGVMQRPKWRAWVASRQHQMPFLYMLALVVLVAAKIYVGTFHYRAIRWWPG